MTLGWNEMCPHTDCQNMITDIWDNSTRGERGLQIVCSHCHRILEITSIGNSRYGLGFQGEPVSQTVERNYHKTRR